ncbi:hypothetical protein [Halorientalis marina]|uniref:hypothetical protein n=1 Tax=Halorientalis marina TaxID=2931976 RepID=UPI001FF395DA|nr:hypothetical protein [Halorientalis marina]
MSETEGVYLTLKREEHIEQFEQAREKVAQDRDVAPDELSRPDVVGAALEAFNNGLLSFDEDKRIRQTREAIARDHDVSPKDVTLECVLKTACGAYNGFQMTDDWDLNGEKQ